MIVPYPASGIIPRKGCEEPLPIKLGSTERKVIVATVWVAAGSLGLGIKREKHYRNMAKRLRLGYRSQADQGTLIDPFAEK